MLTASGTRTTRPTGKGIAWSQYTLLDVIYMMPSLLDRIFNKEEFDAIRNLTMKDLLILTTHIRDDDLSDTPFVFNRQTVCPQPFQLSELYMDDCSTQQTFDYYYSESVWQVPFIWGQHDGSS